MAGATAQPPAELIAFFADELGIQINVDINHLHGNFIFNRKSCSENFVSLDDLIQTSSKYVDAKRAAQPH